MSNDDVKEKSQKGTEYQLEPGWFDRYIVGPLKINPGIVIMAAFAAIIILGIAKGLPVIEKLAEPAFARGLITFIICFATIGLAFMLVCYAFSESSDDRFKRAREIFAGLLGILGTIVGFYFGSATIGGVTPITIADIQVNEKEVATYITGGTLPYQSIIKASGEFDDKTAVTLPKDIKQISQNGWIKYTFEKPLKEANIEIDIQDSQNRTASKKTDFRLPKPQIAVKKWRQVFFVRGGRMRGQPLTCDIGNRANHCPKRQCSRLVTFADDFRVGLKGITLS